MQTSSKACSNFHLQLAAFLFHLTFTTLPFCLSSLLLFLYSFFFFSFSNFSLPITLFVFSLFFQPSNRFVSLFPFDPAAGIRSCHLSLLCAALMPSVSLINHIFSSILSPLATDRSISHCSTPTFNPLTLSLWWLIPSVTHLSHTLTQPSHLHWGVANQFSRKSDFLLCCLTARRDHREWGEERTRETSSYTEINAVPQSKDNN